MISTGNFYYTTGCLTTLDCCLSLMVVEDISFLFKETRNWHNLEYKSAILEYRN